MKDLLQNIGLIAASLTAWYGINAWRREFRGKKEYELAEKVLALFYDCRDRLKVMRCMVASVSEGSTREAHPDETDDESAILNNAHIARERYGKLREAFAQLFALRYRFMSLFGKDAAKPIEDFKHALDDVFLASDMVAQYRLAQGKGHINSDAFKQHLEEMHKYEAVLWGTFSERDKFNTKVETLVSQIEDTCSSVLRPTPFWERMSRGYKKILGKIGKADRRDA